MKPIYKKYSEIEKQIKTLELAKEVLKSDIIKDIEANQFTKKDLDFEYGAFTPRETRSWKYSDKVQDLKDKMDIRKEYEEERGIATVVEVKRGVAFKAK